MATKKEAQTILDQICTGTIQEQYDQGTKSNDVIIKAPTGKVWNDNGKSELRAVKLPFAKGSAARMYDQLIVKMKKGLKDE